jgi:alkanesulfonate monooxygenase SsuD/methylene tetrahydromethanopterin reductase-like flavin-dependent oxidoreductase (luciferase family)
MRFGFVLPNNWGIDDVGAICDLAVEAEELGLDSVWVNHHIVNAGYIADRLDDRPYHDALTVLKPASCSHHFEVHRISPSIAFSFFIS